MRTERAEALIRQALTEGRVRPFIRSKVVRHIEAPMTQMLLGEPQVKQMAAALVRHGFTHDSSMALNTKIAHHKFKRGHRLITVTRFKEPEGNRVVWSSAGLTGHGQDGRGEHYTTLTTHLRAITPRRVHEEQSRFKIEPAPNSGIPPDFADYRNRAWLSPEGKVHALKQGTPEEPWRGDTHGGWAVDNKHVHGESGDLWTMFDNMQANGWVRKTAKDFYDIGPYDEDSIATVHKHFTTHHPELDSVRVYTRENGGTLHRLYKGGVNEQIVHLPPSKFITEPSLDDVPGDWAEMHNRAWISPEGEVHHLKQHPTTPWMSQTHFDWAKSNQELHGFKSSDPFTIPSKLLQNGWVRTTTKNYYHVHEPTEAALETIHKHFTTHHPKLRKVNVHANDGTMITLFKKLRDPAAEKAETDGIARQLTQESEHSWKDEFGELGDFAEPQHRAWISPEGKLHPLGRDGQETHGGWITRVRGPNAFTEYNDMTSAGWVRKVNPRRYSGAKHAVKTALAHARQHHPEVGRILFTVADPPYREYVLDTKTGSGVKRGLRKPMTPVHEVYA